MAVKHDCHLNTLGALELLTQFLVLVIVNLVFVLPLSKHKNSFFLHRLSLIRCVPPSIASSGEETGWTTTAQHFSSALGMLHSCLLHLGKCVSVCFFVCVCVFLLVVGFGFVLFFLVPSICGKCWGSFCFAGLWAKDTVWPFACSFDGTGHALSPAAFPPEVRASVVCCIFSPVQLWFIWIQASWWSFAMCGWTDTTLTMITWFLLPRCPE